MVKKAKKQIEVASENTANKPRNLLVTDATERFTFSFTGTFGSTYNITVNQSPDEETWPGGALWDLGVLLSRFVVGLSGGKSATSTMVVDGKMKSKATPIQLPARVMDIDWRRIFHVDQTIIVELGCGVGLTGMVAAAAFSAKVCVLTDLDVVVDRIALPNSVQNSTPFKGRTAPKRVRTLNRSKAGIVAMPLCWGNSSDEDEVLSLCQSMETVSTTGSGPKKKKKAQKLEPEEPSKIDRELGKPGLVLIGDVAYQHKPGAPSHFEALVSTLMKLVGSHTYVFFGTRIRMPASHDLLAMMLESLEHVVEPVPADEIDSSFSGRKHNMTIHILKRRSN